MKKSPVLPLSIMTCLVPSMSFASPPATLLESSRAQAHLIELYSSEGCSSCPPADEWMASLRGNPKLWRSFVPIEFHVDYWNRLGWTDRFSRRDFTGRQSAYAAAWGTQDVYTPARILDGREWRGSHDLTDLISAGKIVGKLTAERISETRFRVRFKPEVDGSSWVVYGALLGNGLKSVVKSGENSGRTLKHEFVAFTIAIAPMAAAQGTYEAELDVKAGVQQLMSAEAHSTSVAIWVSRAGSQTPVQAVGGDLR